MIRNRTLILVGLAVVLLATSTALAAGTYEVPWWTVNGGGGTSTGTTYAVSGTLGQPDAGPQLSGTTFSLAGGFWGQAGAVPTLDFNIYLPLVSRSHSP
jgi:hypothetical protein